jgi:hypothetical protein
VRAGTDPPVSMFLALCPGAAAVTGRPSFPARCALSPPARSAAS